MGQQPPGRMEEITFELFMASEKAVVLIACEPQKNVVMMNKEATCLLSEVLKHSEIKSDVSKKLWNLVETVYRQGKQRREVIRINEKNVHIKLKKLVLAGIPYVLLSAQKQKTIEDEHVASFLKHGPADELGVLTNAIEDDIINRTLGLNYFISIFDDDTKSFTYYAANPATAICLGVEDPSMLRGKRSDELGFPLEYILEANEIYRQNLDATTGESNFTLPALNSSSVLLFSQFKSVTITLLSLVSPLSSDLAQHQDRFDLRSHAIDHIVRSITCHSLTFWRSQMAEEQMGRLHRRKLPTEFLEDGQRVYGYVYGGMDSFFPTGNADGYIWKSSRVTHHPGRLKRRYFYTQTSAGEKLRRRVMWLEGNDNLCMVEYAHLSHSGDVEAEKLMGPDSMDWTNLISRVSAQDTHAFLSSTEELITMFSVNSRTGKRWDDITTSSEEEDDYFDCQETISSAQTEMSESEFMLELQKYPKVRSNDYQGFDQLNRLNPSVQKQEQTIQSSPNSPKSAIIHISEQTDENFFDLLHRTLMEFYTEEDTKRVVECFKKVQEEYVDSLSLDDIERLAAGMNKLSTNG
ncbi:putative ubiquitin [Planoprotostelium fungivorum]|uniref:Putative ubiquitin n=1 Tax=Planoprotostelium fungivorum TaxID=1890364 RepID=A0A2P6NRS1_9EUKA|nr:putative ubiquitin [Planoprotostelium fungivorum]